MITKTVWNKEYKLIIYPDNDYDPREDSKFGTFIMQHKRYNFWDKDFENHWNSFKEDFAYYINNKYNIIEEFKSDYSMTDEKYEKIYDYIKKSIYYLEVSMTDHS